MRQNTVSGTLIGISAVLLWSSSPACLSYLYNIPVPQVLMTTLGLFFILTAIKLTWLRQWHVVKQPWHLWFIGVLGICGTQAMFYLSFRYAPAPHVVLINYTWPVLTILLSSLLPSERFTFRGILAAMVAMSGVVLVTLYPNDIVPFSQAYLLGYIFAVLSASIWSVYSVLSRYFKATPVEMTAMYCGVGALIAFIMQTCMYQNSQTPTTQQWLIMVYLGLTGSGGAYALWDYGMKHGVVKMICVVAFITPVFAVGWLMLFTQIPFSGIILVASGMVAVGSMIAYPAYKRRVETV